MKKILSLIIIVSLLVLGCSDSSEKIAELEAEIAKAQQEKEDALLSLKSIKADLALYKQAEQKLSFLGNKMQGMRANIITNYGNIEVSFFPDLAPLHCFAFLTRAECGFYDGTKFHRVIKGFMIQGGDPNSKDNNPGDDGMGGPMIMIPHEFNKTKHTPGILSMARVGDTRVGAGSQFFIMHADYPSLDEKYTVFGKVEQGIEVVNKIATSPTGNNNRPVNNAVIKRIEVSKPK